MALLNPCRSFHGCSISCVLLVALLSFSVVRALSATDLETGKFAKHGAEAPAATESQGKTESGIANKWAEQTESIPARKQRAGRSLGLHVNCFSADSFVMTTLSGEVKLMKDIRTGEKVAVFDTASGQLKLEKVLVNHVQDAKVLAEHVVLVTSSGHSISTTPNHQVFSTSTRTESGDVHIRDFASTAKIVPASKVQIGDVIWVMSPKSSDLLPADVTSITWGRKRGMLNPVTSSGTLIVNGVLATTYTTEAGELPPALNAFGITM